jgi:hypothetical protein
MHRNYSHARDAHQAEKSLSNSICRSSPSSILAVAFRIYKPSLLSDRKSVRAHSTLMSNGNHSNSLKTGRVATLHPSLSKAPNIIVRSAAMSKALPAKPEDMNNNTKLKRRHFQRAKHWDIPNEV